jgi:hypothetical protein
MSSRVQSALRGAARAVSVLSAFVTLAACDGDVDPPDGGAAVVLGDGFTGVVVVDESRVRVGFAEDVDAGTLASAFAVSDFTVVPPVVLDVTASAAGAREALVESAAPFIAGVRYTVVVDGVRTTSGRRLSGTLNFTARAGTPVVTSVRVVVDDVETARRYEGLAVLATLADDGAFSESLVAWPLADEGDVFAATLPAQVDPARTLDPGDDADVAADHRALAALVVDATGRPVSALTTFVVAAEAPSDVVIDIVPPPTVTPPPTVDPLPPPPVDDAPGDGVKRVRIVVDDTAARELVDPRLKAAFTAAGAFDATFPQTLTLTAMTGDYAGFWETTVSVAVDEDRVLDGTTLETFPYITYLVVGGVEYEALSALLLAPDEAPQTVRLSLGNPEWTPVTFRVDVSRAYLNPSGSARGVRADEAVYLTGEWQQAVDALGANCGDAFSGGEQTCLRMRELSAHPGVWTRTIWLPPGRPYGWKVVRCDAADGCGPLNALVSSSGRAFATVMKNLVTDNVDAFADPAVGVVDVIAPATTQAGGQVRDYTNATVFAGSGVGSEPDPAGTPDGARMFKQEVPDLVVVVAQQPLTTRVIHVGTWRDVNLGNTPQEIVEGNLSVDLGLSDYDDGFIGRFPPSREDP